jgi:hypothetical protein
MILIFALRLNALPSWLGKIKLLSELKPGAGPNGRIVFLSLFLGQAACSCADDILPSRLRGCGAEIGVLSNNGGISMLGRFTRIVAALGFLASVGAIATSHYAVAKPRTPN